MAIRSLPSVIEGAVDKAAGKTLAREIYPEFVDQLEDSFEQFTMAITSDMDIPEDSVCEVNVTATDGPTLQDDCATVDLTLSGGYGRSWDPADMDDLRSATFRVSVPHFSISDADNRFVQRMA